MTTIMTARTIRRTRVRHLRVPAVRTPISAPREGCFYCGDFPAVVTTHGTEFCPACYRSGSA